MLMLKLKRGETCDVVDGIEIVVDRVVPAEVRLVLTVTDAMHPERATSTLMGVRCQGVCHWYYPLGGPRALVLRCKTGQSISFSDGTEIRLLNAVNGCVTVRLDRPTREQARETPLVFGAFCVVGQGEMQDAEFAAC